MVLFTINTLADEEARGAWAFTLTFWSALSVCGKFVRGLCRADPL